jgi:small subunit ribosomal protein S8
MYTDPISDFLTRIRNAANARQEVVYIPFSNMKAELARILKEEGYIWSYEVEKTEKFPKLKLKIKYIGKDAVVRNLKRISKPGLRKYVNSTEIPKVLGGLGISILSTSRGVMTGAAAKRANVGGEILAEIW